MGCLLGVLFVLLASFLLLVLSQLPEPLGLVLAAIPLAVVVLALVVVHVARRREANPKSHTASQSGQSVPGADEARAAERRKLVARLAVLVGFLSLAPGLAGFLILLSGPDSGLSRLWSVPAFGVAIVLVALSEAMRGWNKTEEAAASRGEAADQISTDSGKANAPAEASNGAGPEALMRQGRYREALEAYREAGVQYLRTHPEATALPENLAKRIGAVQARLDSESPDADS